MPKYKVQLKQGSRTVVNQIEAKSVESVVTFFETLTTMKVSEVLEVKYSNITKPSVDDFNYFKQFKAFLKNDNRETIQVYLQNFKTNKTEKDFEILAKEHLQIASKSVDSIVITAIKT